MKLVYLFVLSLVLCGSAVAQNKTIVLVRHAEKAGETAMDKTGDPDLSPEGQARAKRLVKLVKKYKPHEIYATAYKRVQETVQPIAEERHKQIQTYDPVKQAELVDLILKSKTQHFLIAGHSNTIPMLVNALMGKEVFVKMPDTEYGVIYVVKIRKGKFKRVEVYEY
ncbi:MAG: phosphoglycerate mutase family protein [Pyrinomonadaceae bacterium]